MNPVTTNGTKSTKGIRCKWHAGACPTEELGLILLENFAPSREEEFEVRWFRAKTAKVTSWCIPLVLHGNPREEKDRRPSPCPRPENVGEGFRGMLV